MLTDEQRERRRRFAGASDTPAIFCESPFAGPTDVYVEKTCETKDLPRKGAIEIGELMEMALVNFAARKLGVGVETDPKKLWYQRGLLCANLDGAVVGQMRAIEAKYVGSTYAHLWGEDGSDHVPDYVNLQVQHQMLVADLEAVTVSAAIAGSHALDVRIFHVARSDEICAAIEEEDTRFMVENVAKRVPPTGLPPSLDLLRRVKRVPNKFVDVNPDDVAMWQQTVADLKHAKDLAEAAQAKVLFQMGDADGANAGDLILTYFQQRSGPSTDFGRMKADGVFDKYCKQGTHGVLRVQKGQRKNGY